MIKGQTITVLLVEDNEVDSNLTIEAINSYKLINKIHLSTTGEDALRYLYKQGEYKSVPSPDLILLDLNLPGIDGREVLIDIKHAEELKHIPVVILTASEEEKDIRFAYDNYANSYIPKPLNVNQFIKTIQSLNNFWLSIVASPN